MEILILKILFKFGSINKLIFLKSKKKLFLINLFINYFLENNIKYKIIWNNYFLNKKRFYI